MTQQQILEQLYQSTEEGFLYAVGLFAAPDQPPAPLIQVYYSDWSHEQLAAVRASVDEGLTLVHDQAADRSCSLSLATRQKIAIRAAHDGHTSVLQAPAWDAHLAGVDRRVATQFADQRRRLGGFVLLVQGREHEFLAAVDDSAERVHVGPIQPLSLRPPPGATAP